jgi:hypothetical protein
LKDRSRKLVAERFASARRRDHEHPPPPFEQLFDGFTLPGVKRCEPETLAQSQVDVGHERQAP